MQGNLLEGKALSMKFTPPHGGMMSLDLKMRLLRGELTSLYLYMY